MQLHDIGLRPLAILFAIIAIGPIVMAVVLHRQSETINHYAFWGILAVSVLAFCAIGFSMFNRSIAIQDGNLNIKSTFYSTSVHLSSISGVRIVAPNSKDDIVGTRVNGVGLPGFKSGWFSSKEGGRLFVDRVAGNYLLIFVDGKPRLAIAFADNSAAAEALKTDIIR